MAPTRGAESLLGGPKRPLVGLELTRERPAPGVRAVASSRVPAWPPFARPPEPLRRDERPA